MRIIAAVLLLMSSLAGAEEYFLDNDQRKELLMQGHITGRDGARYNIWIVPGYQPPMENVSKGWHAAGKDLAEYGKPDYFPKMIDMTRLIMRYARKDILRDFALQGTGDAWRESSATAQRRVQRRVFGWWFAWPWAVVEASAESVVRVGVGVPGGVGIWGAGAIVTPAAYLVWPTAMATGHAFGQGVVLPLSAAGWNTLVAPPLALAGQQPAPERADGWWMKRLQDPAEADIRARVATWQRGWHQEPALSALREAMAAEAAAHEARMAALRAQLHAEEQSWADGGDARSGEYRRLAIERALAALPALRSEMAAQGYGLPRLQAQREALREELVASGMDPEVAARVLNAWLGLPDTPPPAFQQTEKTDPAQQVLQRVPAAIDGKP